MNKQEWEEHLQNPDGNLKIILEEFNRLKGQHIMTDAFFKTERLIAIGDDGEDWYYITFDGKNIHWESCVGRIIPLKGHLRDEDYDYIIHIAKLNHYDQLCLKNNDLKMFLDAADKEISEYPDNHRFMTEVCWDLN